MSAIDAWKVTERALASQGMTLHNLGGDIWDVADQMLAAIAELEAERDTRQCGAENPHKMVPKKCPFCGETMIPACCVDFAQECYRDGKKQAEADLAERGS